MSHSTPVFVGVDGSPSSLRAADSAGCEALHRDAELVLLHIGPADDRVFAAALRQLRQCHPTVPVSGRHRPLQQRHYPDGLHAGGVADALAAGAADGCLLFVGHRVQPSRRGPALGSVAQCLVDVATVPTIVERPTDPTWSVTEPRRILAGVAPHASPDAVLEFALAEADRRRTYLDVVCALPRGGTGSSGGASGSGSSGGASGSGGSGGASGSGGSGGFKGDGDSDGGFADGSIGDFADEDIRRWLDKYPEVAGRLHVRRGVDPGIALAVESRTAQLVVVGSASAGHNASVAHALIHRAACPVAIVPPTRLSSCPGRDVRP